MRVGTVNDQHHASRRNLGAGEVGVIQRIHDALREKTRKAAGKKPTPSVAIVDSKSARTGEAGDERGYDAGKKITGRMTHLAVDTLGLVMIVVVHSAALQDYDGACFVLSRMKERFNRLKVVFADSVRPQRPATVGGRDVRLGAADGAAPVGLKGFVVLPKRWIVERTFAWLARYRRTTRDDEKTTLSSEAVVHLAMIRLMARRLAKALELFRDSLDRFAARRSAAARLAKGKTAEVRSVPARSPSVSLAWSKLTPVRFCPAR